MPHRYFAHDMPSRQEAHGGGKEQTCRGESNERARRIVARSPDRTNVLPHVRQTVAIMIARGPRARLLSRGSGRFFSILAACVRLGSRWFNLHRRVAPERAGDLVLRA